MINFVEPIEENDLLNNERNNPLQMHVNDQMKHALTYPRKQP